jgi:phosphoenolpyruvate carboxykinase (diphosphate)
MSTPSPELNSYINLKLAALGQPTSRETADPRFLEIAGPLLRNFHQKDLLLGDRLCPADARIQAFLDDYLRGSSIGGAPRLPARTFVLDRPGLARLMSFPPGAHSFSSPYVRSYRVAQGVLHNPKTDRRTTQGVFHVTEGGLPVPADKIAVPKQTFAALLAEAWRPPRDVLTVPFTGDQDAGVHLFASLLLRPIVCPATGTDPRKTMETRCFAPGSLISNLDFLESIFGNAGDPSLPESDAALDAMHWTGHTGCILLAPHLTVLRKKALGLPHWNDASERQRREGMCWEDENEPYNSGRAFKITCRDERGVIVTILADNYYGYCKKEVKTQISFAANLFGLCEEEHAGGAIAYPAYILGQDFYADRTISLKKAHFEDGVKILGDMVETEPADSDQASYAIDRRYPDIFYVPENAAFHVGEGVVEWNRDGAGHRLKLRAGATYFLPSGFRVRMEKQSSGSAWRLVGTRPRGTFCHKPCTVSGGGKSEISKSIAQALLTGPVFVRDYRSDMDQVAEVFAKDYSSIYKNRPSDDRTRRPILGSERTLGSVIQLLTPSPEYTDAHNEWVRALAQTIRQLVFTIKRYYEPEWGERWREHFTVDRINGFLGHELKFDNQKLASNYLRVGFDRDGSWRIYKLRPDFYPADKLQVEDDISATVVVPRESLNDLDPAYANPSVKLVDNCETLLFQRPDDAVYRGVDKIAEADMSAPGNFLSNYEPLTIDDAKAMVEHVAQFDEYTEPMKTLLRSFVEGGSNGARGHAFAVSPAHPRMVEGKPSKNTRYLQQRPDLVNPRDAYLAEIAARLEREIPADRPVHHPVNTVLPGRRNNPADPKIGLPPLAVYSPIHYQELPELFMEFISSLTGKSPSTTGFGSEGALTKAPFNALWPVVDLNNALVSFILTEYAGFTTSAGHVGPHYRVDHDVSLLVPEIWCRMRVHERDPGFLIQHGYLEKLSDFEHQGQTVQASRLGYRITSSFVDHFLGRVFETANAVFPEDILRPEKQDLDSFVLGMHSIVEAQTGAARNYFEEGSVDAACPPLKALLHIMVHGDYQGLRIGDPAFRALFTRESVLASDWYQERLRTKQDRDIALWSRHLAALEAFRASETFQGPEAFHASVHKSVDLEYRLDYARRQLARVSAPAYLDELFGTIGADPFHGQLGGGKQAYVDPPK